MFIKYKQKCNSTPSLKQTRKFNFRFLGSCHIIRLLTYSRTLKKSTSLINCLGFKIASLEFQKSRENFLRTVSARPLCSSESQQLREDDCYLHRETEKRCGNTKHWRRFCTSEEATIGQALLCSCAILVTQTLMPALFTLQFCQ